MTESIDQDIFNAKQRLQTKLENGDREIRTNLLRLADIGVLKHNRMQLQLAYKFWDYKDDIHKLKELIYLWKKP